MKVALIYHGKCYVGIDPGFKGGIAAVYEDGFAQAFPMPMKENAKGKNEYDIAELREWFAAVKPDYVVIEEVNANPMGGRVQGTTSMFRFGEGYGLLKGILTGLGISYFSVNPKSWKAQILQGTDKDKEAAIAFCKATYPDVSLLPTPRCKVPHDGMADALCLATLAAGRE